MKKYSRLPKKSRQAAIMTAHYLRGRGVFIVYTYVLIHGVYPPVSLWCLRVWSLQ